MENNKLQTVLDNLIPYLRSIIIDEKNDYKPIIYIIGFKTWELPQTDSFDIEVTEINDNVNELGITINDENLGLDELVAFIYWDIIHYNDMLEKTIERIENEKQEELERVKKSLIQGKNFKPLPNKTIEPIKENKTIKNKQKSKLIEKPIENNVLAVSEEVLHTNGISNINDIDRTLLERDEE